MQPKFSPTNHQNAAARLFVRLLLCYVLVLPVALLLKASFPLPHTSAGSVELFFVWVAIASGFTTLTKPLLLFLTAIKAFWDLALLQRILQATASGLVAFLPFNACLLFLFASLILYLLAASRAAYFTFCHTARDSKLLLSRPFWCYLASGACFGAVAILLAILWQQICLML